MGNIKNNLGSKVYNKVESIKSDIEDYWKIWASNYSTKAIKAMRKRIDECILLKGKELDIKSNIKKALLWIHICFSFEKNCYLINLNIHCLRD